MGDKIGKITEVVGRVTGDRGVEAKGQVEQDVSDPAESAEEVGPAEIDKKKQAVRREHRDIDPGTE